MNDYFKIAWRNIWRNKRRTLITTSSIFFGVLLSAFMTSMQEGSYSQYIRTIVNFYSGYIQVHEKGYWDDKTINKTLEDSQSLRSKIKQINGITLQTPRLETFALGSSDEATKGLMIIGIESSKEDSITKISSKIIKGNYLAKEDNGVLVGSKLASFMKLGINDTLVVIGQGYHGVSAAGKYPVRGIIKHPSPELDRTVVYMNVTPMQDLLSAQDRLTSIVVMVSSKDEVTRVKSELISSLGESYEVMDWKEMNSTLMKQIESDRMSNYIVKGILYMIIGFGVLSTIIMMIAERRKEFGVLMSIGMQKTKLSIIVLIETILLGFVGVIAGIIVSIPITWYFSLSPIPITGQAAETMMQMGFDPFLCFSMDPSVYYVQAIIVFLMTLVVGIYPFINIHKTTIIKALRS